MFYCGSETSGWSLEESSLKWIAALALRILTLSKVCSRCVSSSRTKANQGFNSAIIGPRCTSFCKSLISAFETGSGRVCLLESAAQTYCHIRQ